MKFAKYFFGAFILLAIASAFVTPKHHHAKPVTKEHKRFTSVSEELVWTSGTLFDIANSNATTALDLKNSAKWNAAFQSTGTNSCSGNPKVCKARISYSYTTPPDTDPNPSIQQVIDAIYNNYTPDTGSGTGHFPTGNTFTFTVPGNSVVITVIIDTRS